MSIRSKINCFIGLHNWTSKAEKGIKPTKQELKSGLKGFWQYAQMYCDDCGKIYEGSLKQIIDANSEARS